MFRIAIVEDTKSDADRLIMCLLRFQKENDMELKYEWIQNASLFLDGYHRQYDLVFMDIKMPGIDGMKAARELRKTDPTVQLIFLTSLAQYAIEGYEVNALYYVLKPVNYALIEMKLRRALRQTKQQDEYIVISYGAERVSISVSELFYVEIFDHHIQYWTNDGVKKAYGSLKDVEKSLPSTGFFRINNQTIVNLKCVTQVTQGNAVVDDKAFPISRMRKKEFLEALHLYGLNG